MPTAPCSRYALARFCHQFLFVCSHKRQGDDVENGSPILPGGLKLIEPLQMTMDDIVTSCCEELVSVLRSKPLAVGGEGAPPI